MEHSSNGWSNVAQQGMGQRQRQMHLQPRQRKLELRWYYDIPTIAVLGPLTIVVAERSAWRSMSTATTTGARGRW